ncbi:head-tail adaptor protein [Candidatus Tisiphia endosymbiont of Nemotelus uliginosus]|uniref:phage head completion protein n=1 Tax=Candidatus Tisiphia endosymbiont of Nemotelus uliginosus TaxID=3077926 RepID=UPI0035C8C4AE
MQKSIARNLQHQIKFLENFSINELDQDRWQEKFAAYAEIKPICDNRFIAMEHLSFGHVMTEGYYIFKIRFIKNINTNMRILFKERYFEIKRIINVVEQNKFLNVIGLEIYVS